MSQSTDARKCTFSPLSSELYDWHEIESASCAAIGNAQSIAQRSVSPAFEHMLIFELASLFVASSAIRAALPRCSSSGATRTRTRHFNALVATAQSAVPYEHVEVRERGDLAPAAHTPLLIPFTTGSSLSQGVVTV